MLKQSLTLQFRQRENKKVIGIIKDELGGKIMKKFVGLRVKTYSYLTDDVSKGEKMKGRRKWFMKRKLIFEDYTNCLEANRLKNKSKDLWKNKTDIYTLKKIIKNLSKGMLKKGRFKSKNHNFLIKKLIRFL